MKKAWIKIAGVEKEITSDLDASKPFVSFKVKVPAGSQELETGLIDSSGLERAAYYVRIL